MLKRTLGIMLFPSKRELPPIREWHKKNSWRYLEQNETFSSHKWN